MGWSTWPDETGQVLGVSWDGKSSAWRDCGGGGLIFLSIFLNEISVLVS